jgi:hypothetical protein
MGDTVCTLTLLEGIAYLKLVPLRFRAQIIGLIQTHWFWWMGRLLASTEVTLARQREKCKCKYFLSDILYIHLNRW